MVIGNPYSNDFENIGGPCQQVLDDRRLILVSNRQPVQYRTGEDDTIQACQGSGDVAVALSAAARPAPVAWVASTMTNADRQVAQRPDSMGGSTLSH